MLSSGILPVTVGSTQIAQCNVGQEVAVFGLVFVNSTTTARTVVLSLFRQAIGSAQALTIELKAKGDANGRDRISWEKAIALQPGDHLDVSADAVGVNLLWSLDQDTGVNPVATGFDVRGQYSNIAAYVACDIVFKSGSSYVAIRSNIGKDPEVEPADWMLLLDGSGTQNAIDVIVAGAPADMDTLDKISASLGDNPNFATSISGALALKVNGSALASVAFTGDYADLAGIKKLAIRRLFFSRELA